MRLLAMPVKFSDVSFPRRRESIWRHLLRTPYGFPPARE